MNIRIGDVVRFLSDKIEGKVTGIINSTTVNVFCDEYGFEIPANINDLVIIKSDSAVSTAAKEESIKTKGENTETGLYLAIIPLSLGSLSSSLYDFTLINNTKSICLFSVVAENNDFCKGIGNGSILPGSSSLLGEFSMKDIDNNIKHIRIQAIFYQNGNFKMLDPIDYACNINVVNLCKSSSYKKTEWFSTPCILRWLSKKAEEIEKIQESLESAEKDGPQVNSPAQSTSKPQIQGNILEIDLHIDSLLDSTNGMSNSQILDYQMDVFHKTMEENKLKTGKKIIFIHGKGEGILRQRILWELQTKYKKHSHQDASFKQYGYGATQVTIK